MRRVFRLKGWDGPLAVEVKTRRLRRFEKRHGRGSLRRLYQMFLAGRSFQEIRRRYGLTGERVRMIVLQDLRLTGRERQRRFKKRRIIERKPPPPVVKTMAEARRIGLMVESFFSRDVKGAMVMSTTKLLIEGKVCSVRRMLSVKGLAPRSSQLYTYTTVSSGGLKGVDFVIYVRPRDFLIIPARELARFYGRKPRFLYVPLESYSRYHNILPRRHWLEYRNAWWLLKGH